MFDPKQAGTFVDGVWDASILPALLDYIRIPNESSAFDRQWKAHGHMDRAVALVADWCRARAIPGLQLRVVEEGGRTPVILMEIPGRVDDTVLLYGHLDKQPAMVGWRDGLGPWTPVVEGDVLYGRGGADDGYAAFASLTAIAALAKQGVAHARCVVLIEASEESGSPDLPYYVERLASEIGEPSLVVCLDSGCGNYEQLWGTTSLRGMIGGVLTVEVLREGVHSGDASGIVPSSFRILRALLARLEDHDSGTIVPNDFFAEVPGDRAEQAEQAAAVLGDTLWQRFPFADGVQPMGDDNVERVLRRTWRPTLSVTGADHLPPVASAGNVLRARTAVKISVRLPPTLDAGIATTRLCEILLSDPPAGAVVTFVPDPPGSGWNAPEMEPWLAEAVEQASQQHYGKPAVYMGEGGSIPFMGMLGARFPAAQFLITGVLGPHANAHGPNEALHLGYAKKLTACVASILADHAARPR